MDRVITAAKIQDLFPLFPNLIELTSEAHAPCPFCAKAGSVGEKFELNGIEFRGEDRFVLRYHDHTGFCRECQRAGRGANGNFSFHQIAEILHAQVTAEPVVRERIEQPLRLWPQIRVDVAHIQVSRPYWHTFNWTDEAIDRFQLGFGEIYEADGAVHVIPMQIQTVESKPTADYYIEGRRADLVTKHSPGAIRKYFWFVEDCPGDQTIFISEGSKDGISAWMLGFKNFAASFGVGHWSKEKTKFFADRGYKRIIVAGDNDHEGKHFAATVYLWARAFGMDAYILGWDDSFPEKFDVTNLLETLGVDEARKYIETNLDQPSITNTSLHSKAEYITSFKVEADLAYEPSTMEEALPLTEIRGEGPRSINEAIRLFVESYENRKRTEAAVKILRAGPGSGKSFALIRAAERIARKALLKKLQQKRLLLLQIDAVKSQLVANDFEDEAEREVTLAVLDKLQDDLETFSVASVAWLAQFRSGFDDILSNGANANLWFNWTARSRENCSNYDVVMAMGSTYNDIGEFCQTHCQFREQCRKSGYLSQHSARRQRPITVFRHNHIKGGFTDDYDALVVVDEAPFHILEEPVIVRPEMVNPSSNTWDYDIPDWSKVQAVRFFADGLRQAIAHNAGEPERIAGQHNPRFVISGAAFLTLLDQAIRGLSSNDYTLMRCIRMIESDLLELYQPNNEENDARAVTPKIVHIVFKAIEREMWSWNEDPENKFPSQLHLVAGRLEVYNIERVKVRARTPIIVADATALMPDMYAMLFDRALDQIYSPSIVNPNAKTTIIHGSDNTIGNIKVHLGKEITLREKMQVKAVTDVMGEEFDLEEIPWVASDYNNRLFREYVDIIENMAKKHETMLVVSPKILRGLLEDYIYGNFSEYQNRVWFNHYGNVRGTNAYKSCEAVLLIGQFRMPYLVMWRRIQAWARAMGVMEEIPFEFTFKAKPFDTREDGYTYRTFTHPFAQRYLDLVEEAEMQQAAERIRPHATDDQKYVYVLASRPTLKWVTDTTTKAAFLSTIRTDSPLNTVKDAIKQAFLTTGRPLTRNQVLVNFGVGNSTYQRAVELAGKELGVRLPRGKSKVNR